MKTQNHLTDTENRLGVTRGRGQDDKTGKGGQLNGDGWNQTSGGEHAIVEKKPNYNVRRKP